MREVASRTEDNDRTCARCRARHKPLSQRIFNQFICHSTAPQFGDGISSGRSTRRSSIPNQENEGARKGETANGEAAKAPAAAPAFHYRNRSFSVILGFAEWTSERGPRR